MSALEELLAASEPTSWPAEFPPHLSPSSIGYAECPERWRRKYVLGEREPSNTKLLIGQGVHGAAETNYTQKIDSHEDMPADDFLYVAADAFERKREQDEAKYGIDWEGWKPGDALDESVRLARAYHQFASPTFQPTAVEESLEATVPGVPVPIVGRVDIRNEHLTLDIKTAKQKPANGKPLGNWRLKALVYSTMTGLPMGWHVVTKGKTVGVYTPESEAGLYMPAKPGLAQRRIVALTENLVSLFSRYGPDDPWPTSAPEHTFLCGLCGFRETCGWWA